MKVSKHYEAIALILFFLTFGTIMLNRMAQLFMGPDLVSALNLSNTQVGILASGVSICWAFSSLLCGSLSDRIGRKRVLIPALIVFSICSGLSGLVHNFWQMLAVRAALGIAGGPSCIVIMALAEQSSQPEHRGRNLGIVNGAAALVGSAVAPVLVTQIAAAFGWRYSFFLVGIPSLVLSLLVWKFINEPSVNHAVNLANDDGHDSFTLRNNLNVLVNNRQLWLCVLAAAGLTTWLFCFTAFTPLYMTKVMHQSSVRVGLLMSAFGLGSFIYSFVAPSLSDWSGRKPVVFVCGTLAAVTPLVFMIHSLYNTPMLLALIVFLCSGYAPASVAMAMGFAGLGAELLGATISPTLGGWLADQYGLAAPLFMATGGAILVCLVSLFMAETAPRKMASAKALLSTEEMY